MTLISRLIERFKSFDYRHTYVDSLLDAYLATQIQVLRERLGLSQGELAIKAEMHQSQVSKLEDVNNSAWTIKTLRRLARAFDLVLVVRFEEFGSVLPDADEFGRSSLDRRPFAQDPAFAASGAMQQDATPLSSIGMANTSRDLLMFPSRTQPVRISVRDTTDAFFHDAVAQ